MATEPILVGAALTAIGLLLVGTFTVGFKMLLKTNTIYTVLCHPGSGVVDRLESLEQKVDLMQRRIDAAFGLGE